MLGRAASAGAIAAIAAVVAATPAAAETRTLVSPDPTAAEAEALGAQAYDYGFPLLEFLRVRREQTSVRCPDGKGDAPVNSFSNARRFADASERTVVAPNTDTLYSIAHLDLGDGPILLGHPRMGKRYYGFELIDPYTNVIAIPGQREDGGAAASIQVRWRKHGEGVAAPRGARVIKSRYRRVWVIGRTLATDAGDQRKAHRLMTKYRLTKPNGRARRFGRGCDPGEPAEYPTPTDGPGFIAALNRALKRNPPPRRDAALLDRLAPLGVGPGLSPEAAGLAPDVLAALYDGVAAEAAALPGRTRVALFAEALQTDGWFLPPKDIGNYGTDYELRAQVAIAGLGANTPDEAIYPTALAGDDGALLDGARDYRLTFPPGDEPPVRFFWSVTMYDSSGYLVDNPIDRYSLGPTHPPLVEQSDGSIAIAIQRTQPTDPSLNWLPSPSGGFRVNLRLYGPTAAARSGAWRPPAIVGAGP